MRTNGHGKPVIALDIDGTLGDYHLHFLDFAEGWFGRDMPDPKVINLGLPLWEFMEVSQAEYRECKLAYRQGGLKRTMPAYEGAAYLSQGIRAAGAEVWICTTRPYLRLDNIDPDTREWLRRYKIKYDAVLFDTLEGRGSKYIELHRQAGDRVAAVFDDLPEMIAEARTSGISVDTPMYLRDQPYNRYIRCEGDPWRASRVFDCDQMWVAAQNSIESWKAKFDQ